MKRHDHLKNIQHFFFHTFQLQFVNSTIKIDFSNICSTFCAPRSQELKVNRCQTLNSIIFSFLLQDFHYHKNRVCTNKSPCSEWLGYQGPNKGDFWTLERTFCAVYFRKAKNQLIEDLWVHFLRPRRATDY